MEPKEAAEVSAQLTAKKEELTAKRTEFDEFLTKNGLKKNTDYSEHEDEKIAKSWRIKSKAVKTLQAEVEDLKGKAPKKEKKAAVVREPKYSYPEGATSDDKKKIRQATRVKAKAAGVTTDEYLANPAKYAAAVKAKEDAKSEKKVAAGKALAEKAQAKKAEAKAEGVEIAPVAKKVVKKKVEAAD